MTIDLDHVALASADTSPALRFLVGQLGGTVLWGGQAVGFRPMQVLVGDLDGGMKVELLEPWEAERNDFLARFVARHVEGPHHLTFKVPDIRAAIERARGAGFTPINIDLRFPEWMEAFLLPSQAHGTVVQLAESHGDHASIADVLEHNRHHPAEGTPRWWSDPPERAATTYLRRVVLRTTSLPSALGLFAALLGGQVADTGEHHTELVWPGGARLRIEERADAPAGIDRLEVEGLGADMTVLGTRFTPAG